MTLMIYGKISAPSPIAGVGYACCIRLGWHAKTIHTFSELYIYICRPLTHIGKPKAWVLIFMFLTPNMLRFLTVHFRLRQDSNKVMVFWGMRDDGTADLENTDGGLDLHCKHPSPVMHKSVGDMWIILQSLADARCAETC